MSYEEALKFFASKKGMSKKEILVTASRCSPEILQGFSRILDNIIQKQIPYEQGQKEIQKELNTLLKMNPVNVTRRRS